MDAAYEKSLLTDILDPRLADNPLAFVMFCYPWGKKGTPLEHFTGPKKWQCDELNRISDHIRGNRGRIARGEQPTTYQSATASGRGIGKSSLVAWLAHWALSTRLGSSTIISANTEAQLKSRTWAEMGKWHTLAINGHWFEKGALALKPHRWFEDSLKADLGIDTGYYYCMAQLWSEENPDAFAGVHNLNGVLLIFDEASGIPEPIWKVSEGFFTDPILDRYWLTFSNPRRNTGAFYDCFHTHKDYWFRRNVDSRDVEGTDVGKLNQIISKYGADSDTARIEVLGQFPHHGDRQFISREMVEDAAMADDEDMRDPYAPLIMGVDPARFGMDTGVIRFRQGRVARAGFVPPAIELKGRDNMEFANIVAEQINRHKPDAVCIDAGNGTGVIDRLRQLGFRVHEVWFGGKPNDRDKWANKRSEMWGLLRDWLPGGAIDNDSVLKDDLVGPEYKFLGNGDRLALESKEDMKKRGIPSPDHGDALALTFAVNASRRDQMNHHSQANRMARDIDYDMFESRGN